LFGKNFEKEIMKFFSFHLSGFSQTWRGPAVLGGKNTM
jgi:hypothetical protein